MGAAQRFATHGQFGDYEVVRRLAVGGMAEIFLVRTSGYEGFEKTLVLKRILPQHAGNPAFIDMFLREAKIGASLSHPNIAQTFSIGKTDEGDYFYVMEYLNGCDLCAVIEHCPSGVPIPHALTIGTAVSSALNYAHSRQVTGAVTGVIHRDVSPSNIVLTEEGAVKLLDFGIASISATESGSLKGKLAYMAPEQALAKRLDGRADLFALCVVLYELFTGRHPFDPKGNLGLAVFNEIIDGTPPVDPRVHRPELPNEISALLLRGLERDPDNRFQSGDELRSELERTGRSLSAVVSFDELAVWMRTLLSRAPESEGFESATRARWTTVLSADGTAPDEASASQTGKTIVSFSAVPTAPRSETIPGGPFSKDDEAPLRRAGDDGGSLPTTEQRSPAAAVVAAQRLTVAPENEDPGDAGAPARSTSRRTPGSFQWLVAGALVAGVGFAAAFWATRSPGSSPQSHSLEKSNSVESEHAPAILPPASPTRAPETAQPAPGVASSAQAEESAPREAEEPLAADNKDEESEGARVTAEPPKDRLSRSTSRKKRRNLGAKKQEPGPVSAEDDSSKDAPAGIDSLVREESRKWQSGALFPPSSSD